MAHEKTQEINMNAEQQIADLQAQIESAKAQIAQLKAGMQEAKAEEMKQRVDNEEGNLQERNTADAIAAYEADRGLSGNRNKQGDFMAEPDNSPLVVPITLDKENWIDKDERTDEESAKMKRTSNDPVESITRSDGSELEMDGGRAAAKEDESVERTMGFETDDGGTMSVDEKDDYWKTQEGYDKALEMYGRKPAWIKEPTLQWNPEEQKYEKIEEEEFEDLSSPAMSADVKKLFG